jgi:hypothetical protein
MGLAGYRRVLGAPHVLSIVSASLLARLPGVPPLPWPARSRRR